jgi:hypothetical protein
MSSARETESASTICCALDIGRLNLRLVGTTEAYGRRVSSLVSQMLATSAHRLRARRLDHLRVAFEHSPDHSEMATAQAIVQAILRELERTA